MVPHGEQFEENSTVWARKWQSRSQSIYFKLKEINVMTYDHAHLELYKSEKEKKIDLGTRKIVITSNELAMWSSFGEEISHKTASM